MNPLNVFKGKRHVHYSKKDKTRHGEISCVASTQAASIFAADTSGSMSHTLTFGGQRCHSQAWLPQFLWWGQTPSAPSPGSCPASHRWPPALWRWQVGACSCHTQGASGQACSASTSPWMHITQHTFCKGAIQMPLSGQLCLENDMIQ